MLCWEWPFRGLRGVTAARSLGVPLIVLVTDEGLDFDGVYREIAAVRCS
jgi:hypothetical protein